MIWPFSERFAISTCSVENRDVKIVWFWSREQSLYIPSLGRYTTFHFIAYGLWYFQVHEPSNRIKFANNINMRLLGKTVVENPSNTGFLAAVFTSLESSHRITLFSTSRFRRERVSLLFIKRCEIKNSKHSSTKTRFIRKSLALLEFPT